MAPAQKWLNYLHDKSRESAMGEHSNDGAVRLGNAAQFISISSQGDIATGIDNAKRRCHILRRIRWPAPVQSNIAAIRTVCYRIRDFRQVRMMDPRFHLAQMFRLCHLQSVRRNGFHRFLYASRLVRWKHPKAFRIQRRSNLAAPLPPAVR